MSKSLWPLVIAGAAILWSLDAFFRTTLYSLPPVLVSFWEHALGLILIAPFFWKVRHTVRNLSRKEWLGLGYIGLFAGPIGLILYMTALTQTSFANFSIVILLQQTQPIWAILLAALLLREPITKRFLAFAAIAMAGVYLIVFPSLQPNLDTGEQTVLAGILALGAAAFWGSATTIGKMVLEKVPFQTVAFIRFLFAAVFSFLVFVGFAFYQQFRAAADIFGTNYDLGAFFLITPEQWQSLLLIVVLTGATAMLIYYFGLKRVPARVATIFELTWPASSMVIGVLFFDNTFTITQLIGIIMLIGSMIAIARTQTNQKGT